MSEFDIQPTQLSVRSSNPALPRQWTTIICGLSSAGIRYSSVSHPDKVLLLIDLEGIESVSTYGTGKSEPAFQVKWKGSTTLHKCADEETTQQWIDKVMTAKMGPSRPDSDPEDSEEMAEGDVEEPNTTGNASSGDESAEAASAATPSGGSAGRRLAKSEDKSKSNKVKSSGKLSASGSSSSKSKTSESKSSDSKASESSKSKSKSKKDKIKEKSKDKRQASSNPSPRDSKRSSASSSEDTASTASQGKRSKSSVDSYVPQWAAHYNGIKQQERQKHFESLSTQELVRLVSTGLEQEAREEREKVLREWAAVKRAKLDELHALEVAELQKKQAREIDDIQKRLKEFMEQPI